MSREELADVEAELDDFDDADDQEAPETDGEEAEDRQQESEGDAERLSPLPPEEVTKRWHNTKAALAEERALRQRYEALIERIGQERQEQRQPQPTPQGLQKPPSVEDNPLEALKWAQENIQRQIAQQADAERRQMQAAQEAQQTQAFVRQVETLEKDFAASYPDYYEATEHYKRARFEELTAFGYQPAEAQQILARDVMALASAALRAGVNPAQSAYQRAKAMGYRPKADAAAKVQAVRKGRSASSPLSSGGGTAGKRISLADLADLDGEEFDKAFEEYQRQETGRRR